MSLELPETPTPTHRSIENLRQSQVPYHQALRVVPGVWRSILAVVSFAVTGFLLLLVAVIPIANLIDVATGVTAQDFAAGNITMTPGLMLANNLMITALIPASMLLQWAIFGVRPRWLSSVEGRFRWRWLGRLAIVIVPVLAVYVGIIQLLRPIDGVRLDGTATAMIAIVLLTTPLQSAGEEYGFRGLVQRSTGSWLRDPNAAFVLSTALTSVPFALIHLSRDPWLTGYYLVTGIALSLMVRFSGGLEASVLVHAVNNTFLILPTMLAGQAETLLDRSNGTGGPIVLLSIATMLAVSFLVRWLAYRYVIKATAPLPPARTENARSL